MDLLPSLHTTPVYGSTGPVEICIYVYISSIREYVYNLFCVSLEAGGCVVLQILMVFGVTHTHTHQSSPMKGGLNGIREKENIDTPTVLDADDGSPFPI